MFAMEMQPGIDWNLWLVAASTVIAVAASGGGPLATALLLARD